MAETKNGARECLVAPEGMCIVDVDYDAMEMRTWEQICIDMFGKSGCNLWQILNDPRRCPHVELGAEILGDLGDGTFDSTFLDTTFPDTVETWESRYGSAYALKRSKETFLFDGKEESGKALFKIMRNMAKGPNFGLPGGMQWERLQDYCYGGYGVTLSDDRAKLAREKWGFKYMEAFPYLDEVKKILGLKKFGSKGTLEQYFSKRIRGQVGYTDGCNGYFQGLAADIAKKAGWRMVREAYADPKSPLYGCRPAAFVHDEWLFFVPRHTIHEAGFRMRNIMVETAMEYCPDVLFTAMPAAMYRWSKKAGDPIFLHQGKINMDIQLNYKGDVGVLIPYEEQFQLAA